jgi:hypothetical protein
MDDERAARLTRMYTSDARDCAVESFDESGRGQARVGADGQTQESSSDIISGFCAYRGNWIIPFVVATICAFATFNSGASTDALGVIDADGSGRAAGKDLKCAAARAERLVFNCAHSRRLVER